MTVYELIQKLSQHPGDTKIVLAYDWGEPYLDDQYLVLDPPTLSLCNAPPATEGAAVSDSNPFDEHPAGQPAPGTAPDSGAQAAQEPAQDAPAPEVEHSVLPETAAESEAQAPGSDSPSSDEAPEPEQAHAEEAAPVQEIAPTPTEEEAPGGLPAA